MSQSSVLASSIPADVPRSKIEEFFSFCGKIDRIEDYNLSKVEGEQCVHVFFASPSAVSTALLLNGAELGGKPVTVLKFNDSAANMAGHDEKLDNDSPTPAPTETGEDIAQEHKPKSAIFAEYLANGYVLGDNLTKQALEYDKKHGYSDKFKKFIADLDDKYKLQEKQKQVDSKFNLSTKLQKYFDNSQQYVEQAKQTGLGSKLHSFYKNVANDATQIHEEAKRLAELKKKEQQTPGSEGASSGVDAAASVVDTTGTATN